jgi:outer membrane protein assembly factor BamB
MNEETHDAASSVKPLRLWPGVAIAAVAWLARFLIPVLAPEIAPIGMLAGFVGAVLIVVWWLFFSRAPWLERIGALGLLVIVFFAVRPLLHESIATAGMGFLYLIHAVPIYCAVLVIWAVTCRALADGPRRVALVGMLLVAALGWIVLRTEGVDNSGRSDLAWRWSETAEERLLAAGGGSTSGGEAAAASAAATARWPGFRGPERDGSVPGVRIATDWATSPPTELWRRPVGPGWSSFAIGQELLYTQEQRGEEEVVAAYRLADGEPAWRHADPIRFWESNAGAGPRATPQLVDGRLYTLGATGRLNVLDAADGSVIWARDAAADAEVEEPIWGFSGSPLVIGDVVVAALRGRLAAYDRATGEPLWLGPDGGDGYSSPHLATIDGVDQVLFLSAAGAAGFSPVDGELLWEHAWPQGTRIVQPALTGDGDLLLAQGVNSGLRRISVARAASGWSVEERWTTNRLKPYYSDFVVHGGHAYGFDGNILASIDVASGERNWKGGRYGSGQMILLPDQDLLLAISERGELALVGAKPDGFEEIARLPALDGKTWNHPVLVDELLLVRNDREMVAYRLRLAG